MKKKFLSVIICVFMAVGLLTPIAHATDYSASRIVSYVNDRVGESYSNGYCLRFVDECFDYIYGYREYSACAYESGNAYIDSTSRDNIPLGSCIFFGGSSVVCSHCGNNAGHIGIYVGDGNIVHAWAGAIVCTSIDYVVGRGYPYRGYGWLCDVVLTTDTIPLTAPVMQSSKSTYAYGSTVTLSWNTVSGATGYSMYFWSDKKGEIGGLPGIGDNGTVTSGGTSWSGVLEPGNYVVYVSAFNSSEWKTSSGVKFTVSDSIDTPVISSSKSTYAYGQKVTLSWNRIAGASGYSMYFWSDKKGEIGGLPGIGDNGVVTSGGTSWSGILEPGNYKVYVSAFNENEWKTSSAVKFTVEEQVKNPTTSTTATRTSSRIEIQTSISNLSQSASCVAAIYDSSGKLLGQTANDVNGSTNSVTAYFPNYSNASYVKVFLWDSLEGMKPLTNGEKVTL